ncbi:prephenate dehydratase [Gynurincola endophyticus]|uniref:prephenate dehydratase n=1 Tax=Gynurincola endophyticus TaxID=2479004 RepID=UPI0018F6AE6E|nr:prephenate dehydratase [Gynurincola endophyticus]
MITPTASQITTKTVAQATKVSIQGYEGSFHQVAARKFFGDNVEVVPCDTFRQVVKLASDKNACNGGVMAIENSIAGSILPNYNLLQKSDLVITGEIYLPIQQHLLVNKGVKLEEIEEVHSHPMALLQCMDFLDKYQWKLVESEDTALSARKVSEQGTRKVAAIASALAAELFDLDIIVPNIHTMKNNYTRFLVVQPSLMDPIPDSNKASIYFQTDHSRGSLATVLTAIAAGGINLSKLQSFPIPGSDWLYSFYADLEFDHIDQFNEVMKDVKNHTVATKIYGIYKKG